MSEPGLRPVVSPDRSAAAVEADRLCAMLGRIGEAERQINALQAEQAARVAAFVADRRAFDVAAYGSYGDATDRITAAELADARGVGVWTAHHHMLDVASVVSDLPRVFDLWCEGLIGMFAARTAASETCRLNPAALPLADDVIAGEIATVLPGRVRAMVRTRVLEIDPDAAEQAAQEARSQRCVTAGIDAATSAGFVTASLPGEQTAACWSALDSHARSVYAGGDPLQRSVSQIMADTFVERLTGQVLTDVMPVTVNVVMNCSTLLGADDAPGQLTGFGPIPAQAARTLAAGDRAWLRRWFADPADGTVTTVDTRRRRATGGLRVLMKARDQRCRGPGCDGPIVDGDHLEEHAAGGVTSPANVAGECQRCHHLRDHPGVSVQAVGGGALWERRVAAARTGAEAAMLRWTTPIGRHILTQARPAMGDGTATKAQLWYRRLVRQQALSPPPGRREGLPDLDVVHTSGLEDTLKTIIEYAA